VHISSFQILDNQNDKATLASTAFDTAVGPISTEITDQGGPLIEDLIATLVPCASLSNVYVAVVSALCTPAGLMHRLWAYTFLLFLFVFFTFSFVISLCCFTFCQARSNRYQDLDMAEVLNMFKKGIHGDWDYAAEDTDEAPATPPRGHFDTSQLAKGFTA